MSRGGQSYARFVGHDTFPTYDTYIKTAWRKPAASVATGIEYLPADIAKQLERDYVSRYPQDRIDWPARFKAEKWVTKEVTEFEREKIHIAFDEHEIRARADRWSYKCSQMQSFAEMAELAGRVGVRAPTLDEKRTERGAVARMRCPRWWRRAIRKDFTRRAESHLRGSGFVHKRRQVYASDRCVTNHGERKRRDRDMLQSMVAVSDAGEQLELWDVVQASQANPTLRRNELMTRLSGFEEIAQQEGHVAEFVTLTCPSAFHRTLENGQKNPLWEGQTPREGQAWLSKMWARARAKLQRISVLIYGIRVAEPHHDATPHWHMVLFLQRSGVDSLRVVLRETWLAEYGKESGAREHRCSFKEIDPEKGSACGYLAKYIAKNIDGFGVGDDYETTDQDAAESCARVAAWASAHRIRQFQQIGGPAVTVWRELRRLRDCVDDKPTIEAAREAADAGEWARFVKACGGIAAGRGEIRIWREHSGELNQYDELRAADIVGVRCGADSVRTRCKVWRIERKGKCYGTEQMSSCVRDATHDGQRLSVTMRDIGNRQEWTGSAASNADNEVERYSTPVLSSLGPVSITVRGGVEDDRQRISAREGPS